MEDELLTPAELASRWSLTLGALANQRSKGTGVRYIKPGKKIFYRLIDVINFEKKSTYVSTCKKENEE